MPVKHNENVDVLIVGAGPTGLITGLWMAELGIKTCIVDDKETRALNGRTDGFHVRTAEIWDSFGLHGVLREHGVQLHEWCLWAPTEDGPLSRQKRQSMMGPDISRVNGYSMHQGNTEAALIDAIRHRSGPEVERGVVPISMTLDDSLVDDLDAYPVSIELRHQMREDLAIWRTNAHSIQADGTIKPERGAIDAVIGSRYGTDDTIPMINGEASTTKTIHAKFMVGSDGAHSWVRRQLGFQMVGNSTNAVWGVIDAILHADFPDLRRHCTILSQHGTILVVPRENGMTRLYVQLPESFSDASTADPGTGKEIISAARRSLHPYMLDYSYCDWWTIYRVGQRVADHFAYKERIFLGGDAVHTHTPKGGQGMNVSMQDAYNLGWKLAGVIQGRLSRSVLKTYEAERRPVAEDLINLDADMARVLASKTMPNPLEVRRVYEKARNYISGANICYSPNILVTSPDECKQELAVELKLGMRFPSLLIFNHSSAVPLESQTLLRSDGRWRVLVFGGDVTNPAQLQRVNVLGANLAGFGRQFDSIRPDDRPLTEILLIYCGSIESMEIHEFHPTFSRMNASEDRFDFERIYADPPASSYQASAHAHYGIDAEKGCIVVTRPDQCVAWIGDLEDVDGLSNHFRGFVSV